VTESAVVYCRVSSQEQVKNLSLATQQERCTEFCARNGWRVARVFVEEGESAKTQDRAVLKELLAYCRENRGRVQYVIVYAVSRLARNTHDHHMLRAVLAGCGVQLRSVTEPIEETSSGKFVETLLAAVAQFDNDQRSERTITGLKASIARGRWPFLAPLGYLNARVAGVPTLLHDPERAPLIKRAFEMAAGGASKATIYAAMKREGLRNRKSPLTTSTLSRILESPAYMGVIVVPGWNLREQGAFKPIVEAELWHQANAMLSRRKHVAPTHSRSNPDFPLRHFARCAGCQGPLTGGWSTGKLGKRYAYYNCPKRACKVNVRRERLEETFVQRLAELQPSAGFLRLFRAVVMEQLETRRAESGQELANLQRRAADLRRRKEQLVEAYVYRQAIAKDLFDGETLKLNEDLAMIEISISELQVASWDVEELLARGDFLASNAARVWKAASHEQRQRFQRFVFPDGIYVEPGPAGSFSNPSIGLLFTEIRPGAGGENGVARLPSPSSNVGWRQLNDLLAQLATLQDLAAAA
jgi:site-specific DNA recombinase